MSGYSQNDPQWSGDPLGTNGRWTLGQAGCLITAGADVLKAFGHDITPRDLNNLAQSRGLITSDGDVNDWSWLSILFPDVLQYAGHKDWGNDPAELAYFDVRNDTNTEIIVMIDDSPQPGMQTHFMRVVGWDGDKDVIVDDSWDAIRKGVNAYGARWATPVHAQSIIYNATKYLRVQPPAPAPEPTPAPAPEPTTPPPAPTPVPTTTTNSGQTTSVTPTEYDKTQDEKLSALAKVVDILFRYLSKYKLFQKFIKKG